MTTVRTKRLLFDMDGVLISPLGSVERIAALQREFAAAVAPGKVDPIERAIWRGRTGDFGRN